MAFLTYGDLHDFVEDTIPMGKADAMIADATALAVQAAPCLAELDVEPVGETPDALALRLSRLAVVKAILRGAILRWHETGTGAMQSQGVGPFSMTVDTRQQRRGMFWPSEIDQLRALCATTGGAYAIDTVTSMTGIVHADTCSLQFGALYCSCGAVLTQGLPLYGGVW